MEISWKVLLIVLGGAAVTIIPRVFPLVVLSKVNLPNWAVQWLKHIPVAVLAALLAQELLLPDGEIAVAGNLHLLAAVPALLVALLTRNLMGTVITGVVSMLILRTLF